MIAIFPTRELITIDNIYIAVLFLCNQGKKCPVGPPQEGLKIMPQTLVCPVCGLETAEMQKHLFEFGCVAEIKEYSACDIDYSDPKSFEDWVSACSDMVFEEPKMTCACCAGTAENYDEKHLFRVYGKATVDAGHWSRWIEVECAECLGTLLHEDPSMVLKVERIENADWFETHTFEEGC